MKIKEDNIGKGLDSIEKDEGDYDVDYKKKIMGYFDTIDESINVLRYNLIKGELYSDCLIARINIIRIQLEIMEDICLEGQGIKRGK